MPGCVLLSVLAYLPLWTAMHAPHFQKNLATISRGVATTGISTSNAFNSSDAR
ncbi:MAG TPA: hypothetical protein VG146_12145 [Verrucomicrobiae bacterium]|nr:hypothetical protein [Verrucomicrobiae bacterium]